MTTQTQGQHTPGPWKLHGRSTTNHTVLLTNDDGTVGIGRVFHEGGREESYANARLITAAPELLAACQAVIDEWHSKNSNFHTRKPQYLEQARKAIAHATERKN